MPVSLFQMKSVFEVKLFMRRLIILLSLVFLWLGASALATIVTGEAPGAGGRKIKVSRTCSLVSQWTIPLDETTIEADGHFLLQFDVAKTFSAIISIDFHKAELFLEPGAKVNINISPLSEQDEKEMYPFIQAQSLQIDLTDPASNEINTAISTFNALFDTFILEHFNEIYRERNKVLLDTFRNKINRQFGTESDPYFKNYCLYKMASVDQAAMAGSQAMLARKYFIGQPILYENPEYMEFFQSFFKKYLTATSRELRRTDYKTILRGPDPYMSMMKILATDTILSNEQFRELVLMQGVLEFVHTSGFPLEDNLNVLRILQQKTKFPDNKRLAWDLTEYLTYLKPGSPAPDFNLNNLDKKQVSLKSFIGKPVLLWFWTTSCQECLNEMDRLQSLSGKFTDRISFVAISADKDFLTMQYFLKQKQSFHWSFLHIGTSADVLIAYDVRSYPLFILIDKQGKIISYPAEVAGNGLELSIEKLLEQ